MRFLSFYILLAVVAIIAAIPSNIKDEGQSLFNVDVQGHANIGDRNARGSHGGYGGSKKGGYGGGHGGSHGGYRG